MTMLSILTSPPDFRREEVESKCRYVSGYKKPKSITKQVIQLCTLFPGLRDVNTELKARIARGSVKLPKGAEGWGCVPNLMKFIGSGSAGNPEIFGENYSSAVRKMLNAFKYVLGERFYNPRDGEIDEEHLRQSARSIEFWKKLSDAQGNPDILIVPFQFGLRHRGRSIRRARFVFVENEFGLGAFAVGCLLFMHRNRLLHVKDLKIDCAGDEFVREAEGMSERAPYFNSDGDVIKFGAIMIDAAADFYGSVSAFLPECIVES